MWPHWLAAAQIPSMEVILSLSLDQMYFVHYRCKAWKCLSTDYEFLPEDFGYTPSLICLYEIKWIDGGSIGSICQPIEKMQKKCKLYIFTLKN